MMTMMPLFIKGKTEKNVDGGFLKRRETQQCMRKLLDLCDCVAVPQDAVIRYKEEYRVKSI